jgi:deoxyribodipyrimidine photo-lyase
MPKLAVFWFRRDLRLHDNAGLYHALKSGHPVLPVFIFDKAILDDLEPPHERRVEFIHQAVVELADNLQKMGSALGVFYGKPLEVFKKLVSQFPVAEVYTNHDYEPYANQRDTAISDFLKEQSITFKTYKDQCIFEKQEILSGEGRPYTIFTPYSKRWKATLNDFYLKSYPTEKYFSNFTQKEYLSTHFPIQSSISLKDMGFEALNQAFPSKALREDLIQNYAQKRDFPAIQGTSRLSVHLRFGTISIREITRQAVGLSESWLNELIWRDFYMMILANFPRVGDGKAFKTDYDKIEWRNDEREFQAWCTGKTGYPIVDAGMRELNETGFMHNRVRMITASFLIKHLLIDWRWGEGYFAQKLLDFDLSANNGGWQWAASSGCDAAPYFRIFNPTAQTQKFDPQLQYIKGWIPELNSFQYPKPIVEHNFARQRVLEAYKKALGEKESH